MSDIEVYEFEHDFGEGDQMINFVMLDDFNDLQAQLKEAEQTINEQKEVIEGLRQLNKAANTELVLLAGRLGGFPEISSCVNRAIKALNKGDSDGDK